MVLEKRGPMSTYSSSRSKSSSTIIDIGDCECTATLSCFAGSVDFQRSASPMGTYSSRRSRSSSTIIDIGDCVHSQLSTC